MFDAGVIDYSIRARWAALADAGLSIKELAAAGLGPVELDVSIKYLHELVLGDEVDVITRFEYPAPPDGHRGAAAGGQRRRGIGRVPA
ncbi:acyl-CoA thioesterase [Phytohabitans houttuyneae]|uniref:Thioesterase domain-containing protein n=1 Tax=Phytohabitans houttuyneae TaxID=1076126 RepID=A0A6V8KIT9_9ACTN|nr:thioesterase family protein [Phytohabitans houttuyneae]GFJ83754.1 hypothetical protein Phou_079340 [Phytohabitans houttuyneae]